KPKEAYDEKSSKDLRIKQFKAEERDGLEAEISVRDEARIPLLQI
ncbi:hypothetical protein AVEN_123660-1, partial [Araneus ventricosus]